MGNVRVIQTIRHARLDAIKAAIDAAPGPGTLTIYSGTQPATADTALSGNTPLGVLTFSLPSAPAAGTPTPGALTFNAIAQDPLADNSGTATWARVKNSSGGTVFDCDVGTTGASTIVLNTTTIVVNGPIQISSFSLTDPAT